VSARSLQTAGFQVSVPHSWDAAVRENGVVARSPEGAVVSVTHYPLRETYEPAKFKQAVPELDRVAAGLAADAHEPLSGKATQTIGGLRSRVYRYGSTKVAFVLSGRDEYELLCRATGGDDPDGACGLLFSSFSLA
jgi:hypothetical protein